jgi:muramoyltetrapeptide carboxypeptidase LdcA involved in peptidoglycan recycling
VRAVHKAHARQWAAPGRPFLFVKDGPRRVKVRWEDILYVEGLRDYVTILYLETCESIPPAWVLAYLLTGFGERGWLAQFQAILVGRPKAWDFAQPLTLAQKAAYCQQRAAVVPAVRAYNPLIPIVQNLDFGYTDPQLALPSGQLARVLGGEQHIF